MRASTTLTSLMSGLTLCAAQGFISPPEYDIHNDLVHDQWYDLANSSSLVKRGPAADVKWPFDVSTGALKIIGYTYAVGHEQIRKTSEACTEFHDGKTVTRGDCLSHATQLVAGYSIYGVLGYSSDTSCVALMRGIEAIGNTITGDQGQGANAKRAVFSLPLITYSPDIPNSTVDTMNHAIAVNQQQNTHAKLNQERDIAPAPTCDQNNAALTSDDHHWKWAEDYGVKVQCKSGWGNTDYDGNDMTRLISKMSYVVLASQHLNAQFTVFDKVNGRVFARCKLVLEEIPADTCPELIEGQGCHI